MRDSFAREYLKDFNATKAAVRAGYSPKTAASQGHRLLKSASVGSAIARTKSKLLEKEEASVENIVRALNSIAFFDPGDLFDKKGAMLPLHRIPEETRRALTVIQIRELPDSRAGEKKPIGPGYKFESIARVRALSMLIKYHFPQVGKVAGKGPNPPTSATPHRLRLEDIHEILDRSANGIRTASKLRPPKPVATPPSRTGMKGRGSFMRDRFCIEYLKDFNATQAAGRAGYSRKTAASQGQRLLKSAVVREAIAEKTARLLEKIELPG